MRSSLILFVFVESSEHRLQPVTSVLANSRSPHLWRIAEGKPAPTTAERGCHHHSNSACHGVHHLMRRMASSMDLTHTKRCTPTKGHPGKVTSGLPRPIPVGSARPEPTPWQGGGPPRQGGRTYRPLVDCPRVAPRSGLVLQAPPRDAGGGD